MNTFGYTAKVWALAIIIFWLIMGSYLLFTANWHHNLPLSGMLFLGILAIGASFIVSILSWLTFYLIASYILRYHFDAITKKILLVFLLVAIMGLTFIVMDEFNNIEDNLVHPFALTVYSASGIAIIIVKLPVEKMPPQQEDTTILP